VEEASKKQVLGGILLGKMRKKIESNFHKYPCISFNHMISMVPIKIRFKSFLQIINSLLIIRKLLYHDFPQLALSLKGQSIYLFYQLSILKLIRYPIEEIFQSWRPANIITSSEFWPFEYQIISAAKRRAIPSYMIQHGVMDESWWPFLVDNFIVWGKPFQQEMLSFGAPEQRIKILGMPSTDNIFKNQLMFDNNQSTLQNNKFSCLIISQTNAAGMYPEEFKKFFSILKETVIALPDVEWRIKLHPAEYSTLYNSLQMDVRTKLQILPKSTTLEMAVKNSDIAINLFSTAGLEVMIMQRPLVILDLSPRLSKNVWWPSRGGGVYASDSTQLQSIIGQLANDKDVVRQQIARQNEFISNCFENRGNSAKAIIDHILSIKI
jgi:hypothetical protein